MTATPSGEVVVVVHARAAAGKADGLLTAFAACAARTHEEPGCLAYALHRDAADPLHLVLVERWRSQEDLDAHLAQPWVADLRAAMGLPGVLTAPPEVSFVQALGIGDPAKAVLG